ncbi:MAG: 4-hydroxy-tetrahydrodipicolinate synthase, partial [Cyanobacteria bacterium P01_F01_bin.42]
IHATEKASKLDLDGALVVVPYYNKPPQEGLYLHFEAIAKAVPGLPLMLYNIPGRTGQNMTPDTIQRLAKLDNIVAVKAASGSLDQASQIRQRTSPDFAIYSGDDALTLPLLSIGGAGVVSVASHVVGLQMKTMVDAFFDGKVVQASQTFQALLPLFKALFATTNPIPVKAALRLQGWAVGGTRLPLSPVPHEIEVELKQIMAELSVL